MSQEKLELRDKMIRSWLIQRLEKSHGAIGTWSFGGGLINGGLSKKAMAILKEIFSFDYMGSSEFEWGAVPAALNFIAQQSLLGAVISGEVSNVYYICPKSYQKGVVELINTLLKDESPLRLKEYCGLADRVNNPTEFNVDRVGWLELDNGFFFFIDKEMYEKTKQLFGLK